LLSTLDDAETQICILANNQRGRHNWERTDARKNVVTLLKSVRKQADSLIRHMDKSDKERLNV
jgi:hypothetical protein